MTETGWKETTTKNFNIKTFHKHMPDITTDNWVASNKRVYRGKEKGMRLHCPVCKIKWDKISGKINSVMTDKGNQVVCDDCFDKFGSLTALSCYSKYISGSVKSFFLVLFWKYLYQLS